MEKAKLTETEQVEKMALRANNKQRAQRARKLKAISARASKESHHTQTDLMTRTSRALQKFSTNGEIGRGNKNGAPIYSMRRPAMRNPKTELEAAVQRFVDLYDFAPIAYISFDRAGRIEEANLAATELLGVPRDLLIGRPFAFYVADLDSFLRHLLYCRTTHEQVATELELKPKKGERIPVQLLSTPITSTTRNGALLYQTAIIDLSQRKRHEQQLAEQARLLDLSNDAIIVRDVNDRVTYWNKGATKVYGYTLPEALGQVSHDLLKTEHPEPLSKIYQKLLRDNHWQGELVHTRRDGTRITVFSRWSLDRDVQGKRASVLETNNDITERKKAQEKIAEAARQQASLYQLAQRSQTATSLRDVYTAALEGITSALHTDRAAILLFDNRQAMRFVAWQGLSATYRKAAAGHSPWKPSTKNPKPVCIADMRLADISQSLKRTMRREDIRAAAFIPLVIEGNLIGKFMIYYHAPHVFTPSELDLAITMARQVAQAIEHQKDANALRQRERELARELQDQKQLQKISSQMIKQQQIEAVYTQIVEATMALLRSDCGSMQRVLPETGELLLLAQKGFAAGSANGWRRISRNGGTTCAKAFRIGERVIVPDLEQCHFVKKEDLVSYRRSGIRSVQSTPLFSRAGEMVGMISNHWRKVHEPSKRELRLLDVLARQAADLIESKRADEEVRESEARMRATVEQATAGVARCDVNGRIVFVNQKLCDMIGYTESELIGKTFADVMHQDDLDINSRLFRELIRDSKPFELEKRFIRKDGGILWADVSAGAVRGADGKTQSTVFVVVDVTARKKAEAALRRSKQLLEMRVRARTLELNRANKKLEAEISRRKGLEGEILSVSDREQQRLGQELHDGLCQHLTAVAFMTRSIALRLRDHRVVDAADIEKVAELVNTAAVDTRNLSRALHRVDVDAAALVVALQDLVDREIWRTPCRLEIKPSFQINDDAAAAHLYRIAREAVINANKHAQARQIVVRLERVRKEMVLRVIDDGIGFPKDLKPQQGLGYHIMKYRAQLMSGRLEIDSPQTGGTRVSCYLPSHAPGSRKAPNADQTAEGMQKNSDSLIASDLTLRHLARQRAANA